MDCSNRLSTRRELSNYLRSRPCRLDVVVCLYRHGSGWRLRVDLAREVRRYRRAGVRSPRRMVYFFGVIDRIAVGKTNVGNLLGMGREIDV